MACWGIFLPGAKNPTASTCIGGRVVRCDVVDKRIICPRIPLQMYTSANKYDGIIEIGVVEGLFSFGQTVWIDAPTS